MPPANNDNIDPTLLAAIQGVVEKAVKTAVEAALATFNGVVSKLQEEIANLRGKVSEMDERLAVRTDELEQYQRRNNIRLFGIRETTGEVTGEVVTKLCREKLGIELPADAISRSHRVGKLQEAQPGGKVRHRPIIVKFSTYRTRRIVFQSKKRLKGTGVTIRDYLTPRRQEVYRCAVSRVGVKNVWTHDGRVLWVDDGGKRGVATRLTELQV